MTASVSRAQPFYCPYCGEEDFVPSDHRGFAAPGDPGRVPSGAATPRTPAGDDGGYHCRSCDRRFVVRFLGLGPGDEGT